MPFQKVLKHLIVGLFVAGPINGDVESFDPRNLSQEGCGKLEFDSTNFGRERLRNDDTPVFTVGEPIKARRNRHDPGL